MSQAFLHAGEMPRLRDVGTQVTRAPPRQHNVLYYVCRRRDSVAEGIRPATQTATKAPPTTAEKAHKALTKAGSPWAIGLTTDIRVALLQAQTEQGPRHQMSDMTGKILTIHIRGLEGHLVDAMIQCTLHCLHRGPIPDSPPTRDVCLYTYGGFFTIITSLV